MYYLSCACLASDLVRTSIESVFIDYKNYNSVTNEQKEEIIFLSKVYSPYFMHEIKHFIEDIEAPQLLSPDDDNEF